MSLVMTQFRQLFSLLNSKTQRFLHLYVSLFIVCPDVYSSAPVTQDSTRLSNSTTRYPYNSLLIVVRESVGKLFKLHLQLNVYFCSNGLSSIQAFRRVSSEGNVPCTCLQVMTPSSPSLHIPRQLPSTDFFLRAYAPYILIDLSIFLQLDQLARSQQFTLYP